MSLPVQMHGPPAIEAYYTAYQWYKSFEVATPMVELALTCLLLGYLSMY